MERKKRSSLKIASCNVYLVLNWTYLALQSGPFGASRAKRRYITDPWTIGEHSPRRVQTILSKYLTVLDIKKKKLYFLSRQEQLQPQNLNANLPDISLTPDELVIIPHT
jgi:hypothetical protein